MTQNTLTFFEFKKPDKIEKELDKLVEAFQLQLHSDHRQKVQWLDTFDWRLFQQDQCLCFMDNGQQSWLQLQSLHNGDILARLPMDTPPAFAETLPPSRMSDHLIPEFPPRAWLTQAKQVENIEVWALEDEEKKTLARLENQVVKFIPMNPDITPEPMPLLVLRSLRGYEDESARIYEWLRSRKSLAELSFEDVYQRAMAGAGHVPGGYSSKFSLKLEASQTTDSAVREILKTLLVNIEENIDGTIHDRDSEFLHDLRVAVRRSRSALTRIKDVFPQDTVMHFKEELRWIGSFTGACRDLDVYLLALPEFQQHLPEGLRSQLTTFENYLRERKIEEHGHLVSHLQSPRFLTFLSNWKDFLNASPDNEALTDTGATAVMHTAGKATWKMYRRVIEDGSRLTPDSPAERFHELRKDMKKLRYLMELFASLYPAKKWKTQLKLQKTLQNILGDFQDLEVQAEQMLDNGRALYGRNDCSAETLMALGILSEQLREQQQHALDHFEEAFERLASKSCRETFKRLCVSARKGEKA